jgi:hypothetical protein
MSRDGQILRNVNLQPEVYDLVKEESARRRNGEKGFSLTLNQIVLEWLDGYNAGLLPLDRREIQEMPAVANLLDVDGATAETAR